MKISTRTRYGIRGLVELGRSFGQGPLQVKVIAERQGISAKYLEQLMSLLKRGGFLISVRGSKGGYMLARPPEEIKLRDLFCVLEGSVVTVDCVENNVLCDRSKDCATFQLWSDIQTAVMGVLESSTLQDLIENQEKK